MSDFTTTIRDAPFGKLLRYVTNNRILKYPEELDDFQCPHGYENKIGGEPQGPADTEITLTPPANNFDTVDHEKTTGSAGDLEKSNPASAPRASSSATRTNNNNTQRTTSTTSSHLQHAIAPTKTADGLILVDWYTADDPANPQNWSQAKKAWTALLVCLYTLVVYASSSIYLSSEALIMERFGVGEFKASLGLALYVLGTYFTWGGL
jgi:DHA1 family multidrug resistance protein-like MFS transporter